MSAAGLGPPTAGQPRFGSDVVVELLAAYGIDHVAFVPGASFRGIHDSLVHRADGPAIVTTTTEGIAVAIAQGYAKASGRPMAVALHNIVGLQQASMSIYNAWCDRVPMLLLGGTGPMEKASRRPWIDWVHTALVQGNLVRDYVKWDDQPATVADVPESFHRGYTAACASPPGPVYLCYDWALQEQSLAPPPPSESFAVHPTPSDAAPHPADLAWVADRCAEARLPVLITDYAGDTEAGFVALRVLAERLHAPVIDRGGRFCFPTAHPLNFTGIPEILDEADLVVTIDVDDLEGALIGHVFEPARGALRRRDGVTVAHFTPGHYRLRGWSGDYQRMLPVDRVVSASAASALAGLLEVLAQPDADVRAHRESVTRGRVQAARDGWHREAMAAEDPHSVPLNRLVAEVGEAIRSDRWVLGNGTVFGLERRLWDFTRPRQHIGWAGGAGLGYGMGAAIGAALAADEGTICVNIQSDGDFLFTESALWTVANQRLPMLIVMNNNRQYRNSVDHAEHIAKGRKHANADRYTGTALQEPAIDFATVASGYGIWARGPVTDVTTLVKTLSEAVDVVREGRPALVDVVTTGS